MSNARNLANLLGTNTTVQAAKIAAVNASAMPSGSVLQVKYDTTTTQDGTNNTSSSSQTTSDLSVNITPTSTSSTILLLVDIQSYVDGNGNSVYFNIFRDGTRITTGVNGNASRLYVTTQMVTSQSFSYVDSPSTTSQVTYDIRFYVSGGTGYVSVNNGESQITAMEIAG